MNRKNNLRHESPRSGPFSSKDGIIQYYKTCCSSVASAELRRSTPPPPASRKNQRMMGVECQPDHQPLKTPTTFPLKMTTNIMSMSMPPTHLDLVADARAIALLFCCRFLGLFVARATAAVLLGPVLLHPFVSCERIMSYDTILLSTGNAKNN